MKRFKRTKQGGCSIRLWFFLTTLISVLVVPCAVAIENSNGSRVPLIAQTTRENPPENTTGTSQSQTPSNVPQETAEGVPQAPAAAAGEEQSASTLREMFEHGTADGNLRLFYYSSENAFFNPEQDQNTVTVGGRVGFTTAALYGFKLRIAGYAQRGIDHSKNPNKIDNRLGPDISALGEAYLQWEGQDLRVRAGNQRLEAPFTSSYDWRIIPQLYQGVTLRYGDDESYLTAMRITQYKSYTNDDFDKTTNYNRQFVPFAPNTTENTDGFWALGGAHTMQTGPVDLSGEAWFFNYMDYANMYYVESQVAKAEGWIKPFVGLQFIRETDEGKALLGNVDSHAYGMELGLKHNSITASLGYDYIPHEKDAFLNGSLLTPYSHNVASRPWFAEPFLTSTQDLGSGSAYAINVKGKPTPNTIVGGRVSYFDLKPSANSESIDEIEYFVFGIYNFQGALAGLSIADKFGYQTAEVYEDDFWQNRLQLEYSF